MLAELPFLGRKINLISKCDIRYEGVLYSIDPKESTIALSKVRSFGTEDRVGSGRGFIPPKEEVFEYIIFRASDVKDLKLGESDHTMGLSDPAIIQAVGPKHTHTNIGGRGRRSENNQGGNSTRTRREGSRRRVNSRASGGDHNSYQGRPRSQSNRHRNANQVQRKSEDGPNRNTQRRNDNYHQNSRDNRQKNRGQRGSRAAQQFRRQISQRRDTRREPIKFEGDFDFEKANEEFAGLESKLDKLNIAESANGELSGEEAQPKATPTGADGAPMPSETSAAYDKDRSFFDTLTCHQITKPDWRRERRLNAETFGFAY